MAFFTKPDPGTSCLLLVRHGATVANLVRPNRLQGQGTDLPLSEEGRLQAEATGRFLAAAPIERVLASPLARAVQTAEAIAGPHGISVEQCKPVIECDVGHWEGMTWEHIEQQHPEAYDAFMSNPAESGYPGGENFTQVQSRVTPALDRLLEELDGSMAAVVGHNVVNRVYLAGLLGVPLQLGRRISQKNGGINLIRRRGGETKVVTLNSICHLEP